MNFSEFFAMGGYATYVWGSFCVSGLVVIGNVIAVKRFETKVKNEVMKIARNSKVSVP